MIVSSREPFEHTKNLRKPPTGISRNAVRDRDRRAGLNGREGAASCRAYIEQSIGGCYSVKLLVRSEPRCVVGSRRVRERIVESLDPLAGGRTPSFAERDAKRVRFQATPRCPV